MNRSIDRSADLGGSMAFLFLCLAAARRLRVRDSVRAGRGKMVGLVMRIFFRGVCFAWASMMVLWFDAKGGYFNVPWEAFLRAGITIPLGGITFLQGSLWRN